MKHWQLRELDHLGNQNRRLTLHAWHLYIGFCSDLNPIVASIRRLTYILYTSNNAQHMFMCSIVMNHQSVHASWCQLVGIAA